MIEARLHLSTDQRALDVRVNENVTIEVGDLISEIVDAEIGDSEKLTPARIPAVEAAIADRLRALVLGGTIAYHARSEVWYLVEREAGVSS
jgi:hypothetical protein